MPQEYNRSSRSGTGSLLPRRRPLRRGKIFGPISRRALGDARFAFLLNLPTTTFLLLILAFPLVYSIWLAFTQASISDIAAGRSEFVGFLNFVTLFNDPVFLLSLRNTLLFALVSVPLSVFGGLLIALAMKPDQYLIARITRYIVLLPWAVPPVAAGLMWSFIYNPNYGYLNAVLRQLGLVTDFVSIVGDPRWAMLSIIVAYVWRVVPFSAVLIYAGLQSLPDEIFEAASIDGANAWQRFYLITLPLLRPVITVLLVLRTAWSFMIFDEVLTITGGGPGNATWVLSYFTYLTSFRYFELGLGAASAYVLTFLVGIFAFIYIRFVYSETEY